MDGAPPDDVAVPEAEDDANHANTLRVRRQIVEDDPALVHLKVQPDVYLPRPADWEGDGASIAQNTHLKEVTLGPWVVRRGTEAVVVSAGELAKFLEGVRRSSSIQRLSLRECRILNHGVVSTLNRMPDNVVFVELFDCDMQPQGPPLSLFLRDFIHHSPPFRSLKIIKITEIDPCGSTRGVPEQSLRAAAGRLGLKRMILWVGGSRTLSPKVALAFLIGKANDLVVLDLYNSCIEEGSNHAKMLTSARMAQNTAERGAELLDLSVFEYTGWRAVSSVLNGRSFRLSKLSFPNPNVVEGGENLIVGLKSLNLGRHMKSVYFPNGWQKLYDCLQSPTCVLEELDLSGSQFDDDAAVSLFGSLANNKSLKSLNLSGSLRQATSRTWQAVSTLLESPGASLQKLNLCYSPINNDALHAFACNLAVNKSMRELLLYNDPDWNTRWDAFARVLCNKTSIIDTFQSNHTLRRVINNKRQPKSIFPYLAMNDGERSFDVARQKIITVHFSDEIDFGHFIDMDTEVRPHGISWIAGGGLSFCYQCARGMPLFFERSGVALKSDDEPNRKRTKVEEVGR